MAGDVETEQFLFVGEQFVLRPFRQFHHRFRHRRFLFPQHAEERALSALTVGGDARRARERAVDLSKQGGAGFPETIARAGFGERFEHFAVHRAGVHPFAHVREGLEFFAFAARFQNALHRDFADTLDGGEAEADGG